MIKPEAIPTPRVRALPTRAYHGTSSSLNRLCFHTYQVVKDINIMRRQIYIVPSSETLIALNGTRICNNQKIAFGIPIHSPINMDSIISSLCTNIQVARKERKTRNNEATERISAILSTFFSKS